MTKECILFCPMYCVGNSNVSLIETIKNRLDESLPHYQMGFLSSKQLSNFYSESSRSFHFPALECVGKDPRIAILGITKGTTQLDASFELLSANINSTNNLDINTLVELINNTSIHAVFAGNQMRRNISMLFQKIGLWDHLKIDYNKESPEKNVNDLIGLSFHEPNKYFYIASFIKCALLTNRGTSDAPSYKEILNIKGAIRCIENNFLPAFKRYPKMKLIITFGKTSYDFVRNIKIEERPILEHLNESNIRCIFLPHPSGANIGNLNKYLTDQLEMEWITKPQDAIRILKETICL